MFVRRGGGSTRKQAPGRGPPGRGRGRPVRRPRKTKEEIREEKLTAWVAKTKTGKLVQRGEITSLEQIYDRGLPLMEPEIVDYLVPNLQEEVLDVHPVQRTTDAGRKMSFLVTVAVGNKDGLVGVNVGKGKSVRPAIERAMQRAKLKMTVVRRGCGSWECGCGGEHSVPFEVTGSCGSVDMKLMPAPKGTGLVAGAKAKKVLELAGVKDVWTKTKGNTRTTFNFARATLDALKNTRSMKADVRAPAAPKGDAP